MAASIGSIAPDRGHWPQRLRAGSGVVLFAFVLTHFLNHALGIVSVEAMEAVQHYRSGFWRTVPGMALLYGAFAVHVTLALVKTARRRTLRMQWWEGLQLVLGLSIPYLLLPHIIGTRGLNLMFGFDDRYGRELAILWPGLAGNQSVLLMLVWVHAMIGLHYWLRLKAWYRRLIPGLVVAAVAIPLLSLWGWLESARRLALAGGDTVRLTSEQLQWGGLAIEAARTGVLALLFGLAALLAVRFAVGRWRRSVAVTYPGGQVVRIRPGPTVLEISRSNGIPHASVCGGRARCSTCRVRVLAGGDRLDPPSDHESAVLRRIAADGDVRLACQIRPTTNLAVQPMLPVADVSRRTGAPADAYHWGVEQAVAVMFVDIRDFTAISESRLSYDVVFLLNRYLERMSKAILEAGGHVDKYIGDGIMAMFGLTVGVQAGSRQALAAAVAMEGALAELNRELADHLQTPLRIGIGVHAGPAILGRIGAAGGKAAASGLTALGDTVNTASRLESATKELGAMLAVSARTWSAAGLAEDKSLVRHIQVRGRNSALEIYSLASPAILRPRLEALDAAAPATRV